MRSLNSNMTILLLLGFSLCCILTTVLGDFGPCRFDSDRCSCKVGAANQGTCWDKIVGQPGRCSKRFCNAGWTCACGGRSHVCYLGQRSVNVLKNSADISKSTADCQTSSLSLVSSQEISLGTFKIHMSRNGVRANDCSQIAWWHNGVLLGNHRLASGMSDASVGAELVKREDHSLLELRPGDLLAFRFREGSYYCYKHFSELLINGTKITTSMGLTTTHYAREYSANWFLPSFKLTPANTAEDESEPNLQKFLPLRKTKLTTSETLEDGKDYWQPRDDSNADHKRSNWYYRIQIADIITAPVNTI